MNDVVSLGAGHDTFTDVGGNDVICGDGGHATINGGPEWDIGLTETKINCP